MKKLLIAFFAVAFLPLAANAAKYEEGTHYFVVPGQPTNSPEVREYFSYYCPHCRSFESYLGEIESSLPNGTKLKKTHVDFMGQSSPEIQTMLSTGLAIAEKTGLAKQFNAEAFSYIQTKRQPITSLDDVRKIYIAAGGDGATFDKGTKGFAIRGQVKRNKKEQDKLSRGRYLKSVPTLVVNGKYLINNKELDPKNFVQDYKALIAYLLTLD
ncbi:thiol:disulfide interchange protein DsbA/DsbL [Thalassotalea sp. G2M2-11]|uniref:thiol:disulfide interchange protein DsbA/DsbL n=1 Tax=Thalassotalea sp. G2M2-11 TaxID=2787627 RepID=UPI0019D03C42|nr:thiol:disulfide interchange protein DsbA/DsbL [Thalassotalea sp. G2M2-11]